MARRHPTAAARTIPTTATVTFRGRALPATEVVCDCDSPNCRGTHILAPTLTVESLSNEGLHGLVCNRKVLGLPTAA